MRCSAFLVILLMSHFSATAQTTWYVPDDYPAGIQAALSDAAVLNRDTIIVRPGAYLENIDYLGKAITLKSELGPEVTVIDGGQTATVVTFNSGEGPNSVLDGFTITNGKASKGGGIHCTNGSSPTIRHNIILENESTLGGGLYSLYSNPDIRNNLFQLNHASEAGGGLFAWFTPVIIDNTFSENSSTYGGGIFSISSAIVSGNRITQNTANNSGGGIYFGTTLKDWTRHGGRTGLISYNVITGNIASYAGGGIECFDDDPEIIGNLVSGNTASRGGGIDLDLIISDTVLLSSNMITENTATIQGGGVNAYVVDMIAVNNILLGNRAGSNGGGFHTSPWGGGTNQFSNNTISSNSANQGGGIYCDANTKNEIVNSIFWRNNATAGPEIYLSGAGTHFQISHSNVQGNQALVHVDPGSTLVWGTGMIDMDPLYVKLGDGDVHLTYPSPCRNMGDNLASHLPMDDFEGDPRIAQGTADMGADEFSLHLYYTGDATPAGSVQAKFVGLPGTVINGVMLGVNIFDPPLPCDYGLWYMDNPFQIITGLGGVPPTGIAIFPGTIPAVPPAPYTFYLQGVIDMELTNLCPVVIN